MILIKFYKWWIVKKLFFEKKNYTFLVAIIKGVWPYLKKNKKFIIYNKFINMTLSLKFGSAPLFNNNSIIS